MSRLPKLMNGEGKVTFDDVAGLNEEKEEVKELIDFLKNPKKFKQFLSCFLVEHVSAYVNSTI